MINQRYRIFTPEELTDIHKKALLLLEKKGITFASEEAVNCFKNHGIATIGNTVFPDEKTVEEALALCPETFQLAAPNPKRSVTIGKGLLNHPPGGEIFICDPMGNRRLPTLKDCDEIQTLFQACDSIDICGSKPLNPTELDDRIKGLYITRSSMRHSDKPNLTPVEEMGRPQYECLELYKILFGNEKIFEKQYVTWHPVCSVSPLSYSQHACDGIRLFAELKQPVVLVAAPMSGITSPVQLYSTVIQSVAEILGGLVYAQLIQPGTPIVPSASLTFGNLRYASWECAAPDTALLLAGMTQLFRDYYHLPARAQTGVTSAKAVDYQSGLETMQSYLITALCGVNLTSQAVGSMANLMTISPEKIILDDEMVSRVRYILKGMTTGEYSFAYDDIMAAEPNSDFMTAPSTLAHFRESWQPLISDWRSYDSWKELGAKTVTESAAEKIQTILESAPETLLDSEQEKEMAAYIRHIEKSYGLL